MCIRDSEENAGTLLFNAAGSGVIEATFELATRGLLKRSGLVAGLGGNANMKLAEEIVRGGAASIVKNIGSGMASEAASEAATELTSTMWDQVTLGKKMGLGKMSKATKKLWAEFEKIQGDLELMESTMTCLLYTSPSPRDGLLSRMPSSA